MENIMKNAQTTDIAMHTRIAGQYSAQVIHADGSITEVPWFDNMILDSGLDDVGVLGTGIDLRYACHVGTGTAATVASQTTLGARISPTVAPVAPYQSGGTNVNLGAPTYATETTYSFTFGLGGVVGNITEVGLGTNTTAGTNGTRLFCRSLFKDGSGNPIAITVTASDQLVVYHKLITTRTLTDSVGTVTISGTPYGFTTRALNIGSTSATKLLLPSDVLLSANGTTAYTGTVSLAAITASSGPTGTTNGSATGGSYGTYTLGTFTRVSSITWGPTVANAAGGIKGVQLYNVSGYAIAQIVFDTPIMKTNLQQLTLNFQMSWGR